MNFRKCPNCEMENPETEVYCLECGSKLEQDKGPRPLYSARPAKPLASAPPPQPPAPLEMPSPRAAVVQEESAALPPNPPPADTSAQTEMPKTEAVPKTIPAPPPAKTSTGAPIPEPQPEARPAPISPHKVEDRSPRTKPPKIPLIPPGILRLILVAAAVIIVAAVVWRLASRPGRPAAPAPAPNEISLAVLPFRSSGAAVDLAYFGEGLAEELAGGLSRLSGLRLPGLASVLSLMAKSTDGAQMAQSLGAGFALTGTLESVDKRLLVTVRLLKSADGSMIWESRYDRGLEELFGILSDIARGLVQALGLAVPAGEMNALFKTRTVVPEACDFYFRGRSLAARGGRDNLEKAVELFQQAAAKDPGWADIHAGLANAYINLGSASLWSPERSFPAARRAILKAREIEPGLTEARLALAILKWRSEWDLAEAEREFREALLSNPRLSEIRRAFALFLSSLGRHDEAQSEIRAAQDIDPFSPRIQAALGTVLYYARVYDAAEVALARARELNPADPAAYQTLGLLNIQTGDFAGSLRMFQQAAALGGEPRELNLCAAIVLARLGNRVDVGKILTEAMQASGRDYVSSVSLAAVYAGLMEPDQAQACLDKALAEKDASLVFLKVSPLFDAVRSRPWFVDLLQKIGL